MSALTHHEEAMPCWIDVMVANEEEHHDTRAFLSALFDWTWTLGDADTGFYAMAHVNDAPVLGLGQMAGATGAMTTYFATASMEDAIATATEHGATVVMPAMTVMTAGTMAMLVDPAGASYGLWQPDEFAGFGAMYEPNAPGWFDHVSSDPQRDGEFYAAVSGHQLTAMEGDMRILQRGEQWYASISYAQDGEKAQWKPIFVVDSLSRIHETVPRHGGAIVIPEMPVPGSSLCVFSEPVNGTLMTVMAAGDHTD
jgi:predicted enzyme related to lactoylglutathione lyase